MSEDDTKTITTVEWVVTAELTLTGFYCCASFPQELSHLILAINPLREAFSPHFANKEAEAQRG